MKNYIQDGNAIPVTAPRTVASGDVVVVGVLAGVAAHDAASCTSGMIGTEGCVEVEKPSAQAWTQGAAMYVSPSTGICTTEKTAGNLLIGAAIEAAANPSATGKVRLNGAAPAAVTV